MTGAEREPGALVEVRERLAALLPEAGFPTLLDDVAAVVGDALRQARAEALREAAQAYRTDAPGAAVKDWVRGWLDDRADREEQGHDH